MQVQELSVEPLHHNDTLNPSLWDGESLRRDVRYKLLQIAKHFAEFLNVDQLNLKDITISGSNASYGYSKYSDIDLHLVVEHVGDREELYQAKRINIILPTISLLTISLLNCMYRTANNHIIQLESIQY